MSAMTFQRGARATRSAVLRRAGGKHSRRAATALLVLLAVVTALVLGGCRAGDRAASPAVSTAGAGSAPGAAGSPDPLAGVEAVVGAVQRDLDADAGVADR
jgi:hypothetical protein